MTYKKNHLEAYPWILDLRTSPMLAPHFIDVENEAQGSQASQWQKLNISWEPSGPLRLPPQMCPLLSASGCTWGEGGGLLSYSLPLLRSQ